MGAFARNAWSITVILHGMQGGVSLVDVLRQCKQICRFPVYLYGFSQGVCRGGSQDAFYTLSAVKRFYLRLQLIVTYSSFLLFLLKGCYHYSTRLLLIASLLSLIFQMEAFSVNLLIIEKDFLAVEVAIQSFILSNRFHK